MHVQCNLFGGVVLPFVLGGSSQFVEHPSLAFSLPQLKAMVSFKGLND